jgi:hypothetical protein
MPCQPDHNDASITLRKNLAKFFNDYYGEYVKDEDRFVDEMNAFYAVQLNETLNRLAKGLPVYSVCDKQILATACSNLELDTLMNVLICRPGQNHWLGAVSWPVRHGVVHRLHSRARDLRHLSSHRLFAHRCPPLDVCMS